MRADAINMRTIDAARLAVFPAQVTVAQDSGLSERHLDAAYGPRVQFAGTAVRTNECRRVMGMAHARRMAHQPGFRPTHCTVVGQGRPLLFCTEDDRDQDIRQRHDLHQGHDLIGAGRSPTGMGRAWRSKP